MTIDPGVASDPREVLQALQRFMLIHLELTPAPHGSPYMTQPTAPAMVCADEEYEMPSADAMLAGTLALMTGYAQSSPSCPNRSLMARKLISNLFFLMQHPNVSPPLRAMLANLRTRWQLAQEQDMKASTPASEPPRRAAQPTTLWHVAHDTVQ